jgi:hypothetical protein
MLFESDTYTIRRKILVLFGAAFHVHDANGSVIGFSKQKAFKLKEDIRIYSDESCSTEVMTIKARNIIDFSAAYDVVDTRTGETVGTARRKGWTSIFRDAWELLDADERPVAKVQEDSGTMALLRRFLSNLIPQSFDVTTGSGELCAEFNQHFNPFVYRLTVHIDRDSSVDRRLVLGAAVLIAAIEGRQQ